MNLNNKTEKGYSSPPTRFEERQIAEQMKHGSPYLRPMSAEEQEKARLASEQQREEVRKKRISAANGIYGKPRPFEEFGKLPNPPEFLAEIPKLAGESLVTKEQRRALEAALAEDTRLRGLMTQFGNDRALRLIREREGEARQAILSGKTPEPIPDEDTAQAYLFKNRALLAREIEANNRSTVGTLQAIRTKLLAMAERAADEIQGDELEAHAKTDGRWGWPYVPSQTVVQLRQLSWRLPQVPTQCTFGQFHLRDQAAQFGVTL